MRARQTNRRKHFRLQYPPGAGPLFVVRERAFSVSELSERGLHIHTDGRTHAVGEKLAGTLHFADGAEVPVHGAVIRLAEMRSVVCLLDSLGLERMLSEQRRILRDFPHFLFLKDE